MLYSYSFTFSFIFYMCSDKFRGLHPLHLSSPWKYSAHQTFSNILLQVWFAWEKYYARLRWPTYYTCARWKKTKTTSSENGYSKQINTNAIWCDAARVCEGLVWIIYWPSFHRFRCANNNMCVDFFVCETGVHLVKVYDLWIPQPGWGFCYMCSREGYAYSINVRLLWSGFWLLEVGISRGVVDRQKIQHTFGVFHLLPPRKGKAFSFYCWPIGSLWEPMGLCIASRYSFSRRLRRSSWDLWSHLLLLSRDIVVLMPKALTCANGFSSHLR